MSSEANKEDIKVSGSKQPVIQNKEDIKVSSEANKKNIKVSDSRQPVTQTRKIST